jgi:serine protease pet autotransporter
LTNETIGQADVVGVIARKGKTTVVNTSGDISITTSGIAKGGQSTDPIPVHAYGGTIEIYAGGNIKLLSSDGNAIMSQPTVNDSGKFSSSVSLTAGGDIVIESDGAAVLAGLIQNGLSDKSSSVTINATNVSITSKKDVAVKIYDQDQTWNPNDPRPGNAFVELHAEKKLALNGATYGIDQVRNGAESTIGSTSKFSAEEEIVINGDSAGIRARNKEGIHSPNNLNIYAPKINVTGASSAAVLADSGANIQFAGDEKGTTKTNVTLSGNQDAVRTVETSTVGFTNATVDVAKGNINSNGKSESNGKLELNNSNVIMHGGNFNANTLTGTGTSSITLNDAKSTVYVSDNQSNNLAVTAGSTLNDTFNSVEEAAAALKSVTNITNNQKGGSYSFAGQSGALSDTWTADNDGNITSRTTNQSLDAFGNYNAMTLVQWRNEVNHISQRLGDVRDSSTTIGAWARVYGYDSSYDDNVSIDFKANSIQAGGDYRINNTWLVGGAFSYTDGEGKFSNGSADSDGYSLAAYLSGFFDCGAYVDFVGRIGRLSTDITAYSDASEFKGSYNNTTFGLSAEVGYHWKLSDTFYVEPQAELAYGFVKGDDFTGANDVRVEQDDFQTLVGRLGARIGASFADGAGTVYAHASVNHDFLGDADYTASLGSVSRDLSVDIGGTWVSYGIGAQFNTSKNLNFYGTLERANGSEYQEDYRYSVGMSYRF